MFQNKFRQCEALWQNSIEAIRADCGDYGAAIMEGYWQQVSEDAQFLKDPTALRQCTNAELWEARWVGRDSQIKALDLPRRLRVRYDDLYARVCDAGTRYNTLIDPREMPKLDLVAVNTWCDQINQELIQGLTSSVDYLWEDYDPEHQDEEFDKRYGRMLNYVQYGFPPYGPSENSPKEARDFAAWIRQKSEKLSYDARRADLTDRAGPWVYQGYLGSGSFGCVSIWHQYSRNFTVINRAAIKECYNARYWNDNVRWEGPKELRVPSEFTIQKSLSESRGGHNIVHCRAYGLYESMSMYRLYMEYCQHGDLESALEDYERLSRIKTFFSVIGPTVRFPDRYLWCIFEGLVGAACLMNYGHLPGGEESAGHNHRPIIHRDLKPANIFLAAPHKTWPGIPTAKVGDWGLSAYADMDGVPKAAQGTLGYRAPEVCDFGRTYPISPASDIWVIGRAMLSLVNLSYEKEYQEWLPDDVDFTTTAKFKPELADGVDPRLINLIQQCMEPVPANRPDPKSLYREIQQNPVVKRLKKQGTPKPEQEVLTVRGDPYPAFAL